MSLEGRYLDRAQRLAQRYFSDAGEQADLADAIVLLLREFIHHDMEWAALAVERFRDEENEAGTPCTPWGGFTDLAASFRKRGCEP